jgi:hypothetical protein
MLSVTHRRDAEMAQRLSCLILSLCALCVSAVNNDSSSTKLKMVYDCF